MLSQNVSLAVHLSICSSVRLRYGVKTAKYVVEILPPHVSLIILVFLKLNRVSINSDKVTLIKGGTLSTRGYIKIRDFRPVNHCISETVQDRVIVTVERYRPTNS